MTLDTLPEQEVPQPAEEIPTLNQPEETDTSPNNVSRAAANLSSELSEITTNNPHIDLSPEIREMAILMDELKAWEARSAKDGEVDPLEREHMEEVYEKYKDVLGVYEITPLDYEDENFGFVMQNRNNPALQADWILADLDDTMIGTQEVKSKRQELYSGYLKDLGIDLPPEKVKEIIKKTDKFSRWQDTPNGSKDCYHPIAHMASLQMITDALSKTTDPQEIAGVIDEVGKNLDRVKGELTGDTAPQAGDLFRITPDGRFILVVGETPPWSKEIEEIFKDTMIAPPRYARNVSAFNHEDGLNALHPNIDIVNTGVFTSGTPSYQLYKMGELLRENPDLDFTTLMFTRVGKDQFLREFIKRNGIKNSRIVMYDDSIKNGQSLEQLGEEMHEETGNTIIGVVAKTPFAKDVQNQSELTTLDHDDQTVDIRTSLRSALNARDNQITNS